MVTRAESRSKLVLAGLAGVAVGVLASFAGGYVWAARHADLGRSRNEASTAPAVKSTEGTRIVLDRRVTAVDEQRLAQLEARVAALTPPPSSGAPTAAPTPLESQQRYEARLRQHVAEPVDAGWSRPTASLIQEDLLKQARSMSFRVGRIDCRTTSCTAELEWPSMAEADREYLSLVHSTYRANCSRTVVLPPPSGGEGPLRAEMLLDCESWRADGGEPLETGQSP